MFTPTRPTSATEPPDWSQRIPRRAAEAQNPIVKAFYGSGAVAPDTPLRQVPFVALDLETTGLDAEQHSILSIGLVPFTLERIPLAGAQHWLVKPDRPLSEDSILIHHITHEAIQQAPPIQDILPRVLDHLAGRIVVVHYRAIERRFLHRAALNCFNEALEFPVVDTMELEARVYRKSSPGFFSRLLGRQPKPIRLSDARIRLNLPFYPPHDALTDAIATAELLQAQVAQRYSPETPIGTLWR
ncbi:MAG: 3'-5' exonuclease [Natronospirillum sp.]|uniref:3'-5' exonuclease n=1 Tax=Natronospirillum sp. TaxID=2812955 RepID=UPI0025F717C8|nr:3'-5' exonuclease [Natronospirillum sp.]MCH8551820.1 3'-5' exonuclease [Natronospirillum sp.]